MKKYKLIKEYPGSPKLGTIIEWSAVLHKYTSGVLGVFTCSKEITVNNPEYWEEVIEKDYEILSFKGVRARDISEDGAYLWCRGGNSYFKHKDTLDYIVEKYGIKSVKRLSDGEIFTVGDEIVYDRTVPIKAKIKAFIISNSKLLVSKDCTMDISELSKIQHINKQVSVVEEEVEKDYEILSFVRNNKPLSNAVGCIKVKISKGYFVWDITDRKDKESDLINNTGFDIYSVKRLSDGEIFTIGDKIICSFSKSESIITNFKIDENQKIKINTKGVNFLGGSYFLNNIKHIKQPLFTTEDGVDIFEGDEFWEEVNDNNPLNLEVGKEYMLRYIHCKSNPIKVLITHFTKNGHPWGKELNGIVTPGSYELIKKVVEKDYEILSLIYKDNKKLCYLDKRDGFYKYKGHFNYLREGESNLKACLENNWSIHSVKRLSDSEVFTVGDTVTETITERCNGWRISEFSLKDIRCFTAGVNINNIEKVKQALCTTEDGVDIFEGDECWLVSKEYNYQLAQYKINNIDIFYIPAKNWYFSTKEAAEEYILMNKPCLSINDVINSYSGLYDIYRNHTIRNIKNLVKSKI